MQHDAQSDFHLRAVNNETAEIMKVVTHAVEVFGDSGMMLDSGMKKFRDANVIPPLDANMIVSQFKVIKSLFPQSPAHIPDRRAECARQP